MLNRRSLLFSLGLAAVAAGTAGCSAPAPAAPADDSYSHTLAGYGGKTVTLPRAPQRVVTDFYSLAALAPYGIRPVGAWGYGLDDDTSLGGASIEGVQIVGKDAEFNLETLAGLTPDVLIGFGNADGTGWTWWEEPVAEQATAIAPFMPIEMRGRGVDELIGEYAELARSLGGAVDTPELARARDDYAAAQERIRGLTADKQLTVLPLSIGADTNYVGVNQAQLQLLGACGVRFTEYPVEGDSAWAEVSWENLAGDESDLIMVLDGYPAEAEKNPVFGDLAAIRAGQRTPWNDKRPYHHANYAAWLNQFADAYTAARPLT